MSAVRQQKLPIFTFPIISQLKTISFHSNQSSNPIGTKNTIICSPTPSIDAICGIWKESASRLQRRNRLKMFTTDDGRTDGSYTISSHLSLRLRWAKNHLLCNQKTNDLECWYAALGTRLLPSLFKWWPWDDLDLLCGKVKFGPLCFCMGKG